MKKLAVFILGDLLLLFHVEGKNYEYFTIDTLLKNSIEKKCNKKIKCFLSLLLGILFFTPLSANSNELTTRYSIHLLGTSIGEFSVSQTSRNQKVMIEAITEVKVNLLFSFHIKYIQSTVYNQGILQSAHIEIFKNGKLNSTTWIKYEKGSYQLIVDGDTTIINDSITYSGSLLYFNEPIAKKRIFKERNAEMSQIGPEGEHTYIIKDEKERVLNRYFYEEGILQHATMRHALGNVELIRVTGK